MKRTAQLEWRLLFRLAHIIPDYSELGAYAGSMQAGVYNDAAATLPKLIIMLTYGDAELAKTLKAFLEHLVLAEELFTGDDHCLTNNIVFKDRGPLLYWLANERPLPTCG